MTSFSITRIYVFARVDMQVICIRCIMRSIKDRYPDDLLISKSRCFYCISYMFSASNCYFLHRSWTLACFITNLIIIFKNCSNFNSIGAFYLEITQPFGKLWTFDFMMICVSVCLPFFNETTTAAKMSSSPAKLIFSSGIQIKCRK